jgi:hypothetical protein
MFTGPAVAGVNMPTEKTALESRMTAELGLYKNAATFVHLVRNLPMKVKDFRAAFETVYDRLYEAGKDIILKLYPRVSTTEYREANADNRSVQLRPL